LLEDQDAWRLPLVLQGAQQSPAVLVKNESVTGNVPKNLSAGRTLKEHVAADQQLTRMEIGYCLDGSSHKQSPAVLVSSNETVRQIPDRVGLQTRRSQRWLPTTSSHNWIKDERDR